ncbi:ABC transporter permease [Clostridium hydrogenum]|uniref:ABC transporter permease n=1 Tax=Clostridium hydrogenum TaxID=2855764 RepID=UPI001F2BFCEA|nr:ABC transporter permease [Clostridium hydrogenum]
MSVKSLSVFLYLKCNLKKFIPQILVVSLGVFLMYFICIIGGGIESQMQDNVLKPYEKLSYITINPAKENEQSYIDKLKTNKDIDRIIYSKRAMNITADVLIAACGSPAFFTSERDTEYLMKKMNFKLASGRIPREDNEILISNNYAKSKKLKLGSYLGEKVDKNLTESYKVVGIYNGKNIIAFGHIKSYESVMKDVNSIIIIPKEGRMSRVNDYINSHKDKQITLVDYTMMNYDIGGFFPMFTVFAVVILIITTFVLTFTIGNMNYIHFFDRVGEFSILDALGYTKLDIFFKLFKEMCIVIVVGFVFGIALSIIGGNMFNGIYCIPKGVPVEVYNKWYVILSIIVPIAVGGFSSIPTIRFLKNMNTVDVLEGRNF